GLSKLTSEAYLQLAKNIYGIDYTVFRYANIYGPRQDAHGEGGVVAIFSDKIYAGESITIYGDGMQTRDFVYVKDVADANIKALKEAGGMVLNISTCEKTTVNDLLETMVSLSGKEMKPHYAEERVGDIRD